jgi:hypothetical protein
MLAMIVPSLGAIRRSISFVHCSPLGVVYLAASDYTNSNDYVSKAGIKEIGVRMLRNIRYNGAAWKEDERGCIHYGRQRFDQ